MDVAAERGWGDAARIGGRSWGRVGAPSWVAVGGSVRGREAEVGSGGVWAGGGGMAGPSWSSGDDGAPPWLPAGPTRVGSSPSRSHSR